LQGGVAEQNYDKGEKNSFNKNYLINKRLTQSLPELAK
jgi:hypothetical protein